MYTIEEVKKEALKVIEAQRWIENGLFSMPYKEITESEILEKAKQIYEHKIPSTKVVKDLKELKRERVM